MESDVTSLGLQAALVLFLVKEAVATFRSWQTRRQNKDDLTDRQQHDEIIKAREKIEQLYIGQMEQQKLQFEQQRDTLMIIDHISDALDANTAENKQSRIAFEKELPENTTAIRYLTEQVAGLKRRMDQ